MTLGAIRLGNQNDLAVDAVTGRLADALRDSIAVLTGFTP
jgi:hypothetical protein